MKCPFCGKNLIDGDFVCPHCHRLAFDFDYFENMEKMEKKYSKSSFLDLSKEELTFDEIVTIYSFIERGDHHGGGTDFHDGCAEDGTFSNLSKRLKEIRNNR